MSGSLIFCICLAYFVAAYYLYGGLLRRMFAIDPRRPTPATTEYDGLDYVPTPRIVLFGHHFASIAGPGPIVGPILAAYFGWLPALIWILVGCVFVGAFHDFAALVMSVRNRGRSISFVLERLMGYTGRQLFLMFCLACLILIVGIFSILVSTLFVQMPSVASASLLFIALAPGFALFTSGLRVGLRNASLVFVPLVFAAAFVGAQFPLDLVQGLGLETSTASMIWLAVLALYIFGASIVPVQWLLQPRDYLNSYLLYAMLLLGLCSILVYNPEVRLESFVGYEAVTADGHLTEMVPALFILIACGACSGFHALVASGTTAKQVRSENDLLPIGYGSMIIEGVVGVMALVAVMSMDLETFRELGRNQPLAFATGIASFSEALGLDAHYTRIFISLAISAFMLTSLDTATRLGRFLWQELFLPRSPAAEGAAEDRAAPPQLAAWRRVLTHPALASCIIVGLSLAMALTGKAASIWPIFGASNQLMAALTFLAITLYMLTRGMKWIIAFIPMCFMLVMSLWGVVQVITIQWGHSSILVGAGVILLVMSLLLTGIGISIMQQHLRSRLRGGGVTQPDMDAAD